MNHARRSLGVVLLTATITGCISTPKVRTANLSPEMLSVLLPSRIEIVEPFTRVTTFGDGDTPDGIELLMQAVNALDNAGLMMVGRLRIELFEYVPGSGESKSRMLEQWSVDLSSAQQQKPHWNALTQMYEFRLAVDPARVLPADRYVLAVTYDSPLGDRLTDECLVAYPKRSKQRPQKP